ncbi:MAG: putative lipoic acid-binding regulatory protein [Candidatus Krumholzibacteriia bacterium]|jgi:putative lipoic acid-binding regulatory protein
MSADNDKKPIIEYPCPWDYKIIGTDESVLRDAVDKCLGDALSQIAGEREYELGMSRTSDGGKFVSLKLNLMVMDEAERNGIFSSLAGHPAIRIVI